VAFTGSTAVGKHIMRVCADRLARVSLELGGKSAAVLLPDADFAKALPSLMVYSMPITGQVCFSLTRLLVPEARKREFLDMFLPAVQAIKVGDPADPGHPDGAAGDGAAARAGGGLYRRGARRGRAAGLRWRAAARAWTKGFFVEPTVFTDVTPDMKIAQEEIFGPVVSVIGYDDEDDAARKANATPYGLNGAVYSADPERAFALPADADGRADGQRADRGPEAPLRRLSQSGMGREGGPEGLENYLEVKTVHMAGSVWARTKPVGSST
jgi:aldehyde dehydrogenase (NAD+)